MTPTEQDNELEFCENCGEKCGASLPYGKDCNTELRSAIRLLATAKVQNVPDAKYGFWHHLDTSSLDDIMQLITADRNRVALEERIEALQWALNDFNMPDTDTQKNIQEYINDLKAKQEEV